MTTDILEVPELRDRIARYSVEVYDRMPERNENGRRTELIRGIVLEKMPKSPLHQSLAEKIRDFFLAKAPSGFCVKTDSPLVLHDSVPEPDILVVRGSRRDYAEQHPVTAELVVEIAVTSLREDRELASIFAEAGVSEYWIVIPKQRVVEVFRNPQEGKYADREILSVGQTLSCASIPGIALDVAELFAP